MPRFNVYVPSVRPVPDKLFVMAVEADAAEAAVDKGRAMAKGRVLVDLDCWAEPEGLTPAGGFAVWGTDGKGRRDDSLSSCDTPQEAVCRARHAVGLMGWRWAVAETTEGFLLKAFVCPRYWKQVHTDFKSERDGVCHMLVLDRKTGATVSIPVTVG